MRKVCAEAILLVVAIKRFLARTSCSTTRDLDRIFPFESVRGTKKGEKRVVDICNAEAKKERKKKKRHTTGCLINGLSTLAGLPFAPPLLLNVVGINRRSDLSTLWVWVRRRKRERDSFQREKETTSFFLSFFLTGQTRNEFHSYLSMYPSIHPSIHLVEITFDARSTTIGLARLCGNKSI